MIVVARNDQIGLSGDQLSEFEQCSNLTSFQFWQLTYIILNIAETDMTFWSSDDWYWAMSDLTAIWHNLILVMRFKADYWHEMERNQHKSDLRIYIYKIDAGVHFGFGFMNILSVNRGYIVFTFYYTHLEII